MDIRDALFADALAMPVLCSLLLLFACNKEHETGTKSEQEHGRTTGTRASPVTFMVGEWEGDVHQQKTNTLYVVRVSYLEDGGNSVTYPADQCGGHWTPVTSSASEATFTEHIDYGTSQCIPTGTVIVKDLAGNLSYQWRGNGEVVAGVLHRRAQ